MCEDRRVHAVVCLDLSKLEDWDEIRDLGRKIVNFVRQIVENEAKMLRLIRLPRKSKR